MLKSIENLLLFLYNKGASAHGISLDNKHKPHITALQYVIVVIFAAISIPENRNIFKKREYMLVILIVL